MNKQMLELDQEVKTLRESQHELKDYKESTEPILEDLRKSFKDSQEKYEVSEAEVKKLRSALETEQQKAKQEISSLEEAKNLLISQKLEIQNQIDGMEEQVRKAEAVVESTKTASSNVQHLLREENSTLQHKLDEKQKELETVQKQLDEESARTELQLSVLNENLGTVRGDLVAAQQQVSELTKLADELKGEKLELEAKLENNNDERRVLLERCLKSEGEFEKVQTKTLELKRKLDDSQAALQEIGRENQSLQITNTKVQSRKWVEDNEVKECMGCSKKFSVAIRKHHCRRCGNIFCNECSSREAKLPMARKPVRMCDSCYLEVVDEGY